jgi:hypothetical protein
MVSTCLLPRLVQAPVHKTEVKWAPHVRCNCGRHAKHATQLVMKALCMYWPTFCVTGTLARGRTCMPAWGWHGGEIQSACGPSPLSLLAVPAHGCHVLAQNFQIHVVTLHLVAHIPWFATP